MKFTAVVLGIIYVFTSYFSLAQNPGNIGTANLTAWFMPDGLVLGDVTSWTTTFPTGLGAISVTDAITPFPQATNTPAGDIANYNTTIEFTANTLVNLKALQNTSTTLDLLDNSSAGDEGTFFCVYYKPATSINNHMLLYNESAGASDAIQFRNLGANGRFAIGKGLGTNINATRNWVENFKPTIISYTGNRSGAATMTAYESSLEITASTASQSSGATGLYMGIMPGNANSPFNGYLSEYIFYDRDLTADELARVHTYLAIKYGITLDIGAGASPQGNYQASIFGANFNVWDASNFPSYHNDVIGIARDDTSGLLQKQSHSFDDSYRIYLDVLQPTNVANTGFFPTDTSFVLIGHNNGVSCATAASNLEVPAAPILHSRIEREWKVTNTNFHSFTYSCDFRLDACATQSNFEYNCLRLLVDDDGDFTNATVYDASSGLNFSYSGGIVTVSGISELHIPDDSTRFITLGSVSVPNSNLGNDTLLCQGQNLALDVTTPGGTYLWHDNSVNPTFLVTTTGTYWVEVSNGVCTVSDTIEVTDLVFAANLGGDTTICQGDSLLLDVTAMGATYLWQNNSTDSAIYISQPGIYWVDVSISGCTERDSMVLMVNPSPVFDFGNDTIICENDILFLDATTLGATYLWQDNSMNPTFNVMQNGTYYAEVTLNSCVHADSIDVTYQVITVDLGNDTILCQGETISRDVTLAGATYLWQDNSVNPTYTISQAGTYWVDVMINNCVQRDSIIVTYNPIPTPNLGNDTTLCQFQTLLLDVTEPGATYSWQDNSINPFFDISQAGIYWVESTLNNCSHRDSIEVLYTQLPVVNLGADVTLCAGETYLIDATNAGASYLWQDNSTAATFNVGSAGQYHVLVTSGNCMATDTINVSYFAAVGLTFDAAPLLCEGDFFQFTHNIPESDILSSEWSFGNGQTSSEFSPRIQFNDAGSFVINLKIISINNCENNYSTSITIQIKPVADFSYSPDKPLKETEVELTDHSVGAISWFWEFGEGTNSIDPSPTVIYSKPGYYQITQTVFSDLCSDTITKTILIRDELLFYVPNIFTPSSGSNNLQFLPVFTSGFDPYNYHLLMYNRYGEIIFESFDHTVGWDGRYNNELVKTGVYVWQIQYKQSFTSEKSIIHGHVTVLR